MESVPCAITPSMAAWLSFLEVKLKMKVQVEENRQNPGLCSHSRIYKTTPVALQARPVRRSSQVRFVCERRHSPLRMSA